MYSVPRGSGLGKSNHCLFTQLASKLKGTLPSPRVGSQLGQGSRAHAHRPSKASQLSGHDILSLGTGRRAPARESLLILPGGSGLGPGYPEGPS